MACQLEKQLLLFTLDDSLTELRLRVHKGILVASEPELV